MTETIYDMVIFQMKCEPPSEDNRLHTNTALHTHACERNNNICCCMGKLLIQDNYSKFIPCSGILLFRTILVLIG